MELQLLIDSETPGSRLELQPGEFFGQVTIDKALIIAGKGKSTWIGSRIAPTIRITVPGVKLQNLMVEVTACEDAIALEALPGTNPVLEDVVARGRIVGVSPDNIRSTAPVMEKKPTKVSFEPPPPLDSNVSGQETTSWQPLSGTRSSRSRAPWLLWGIFAALVVALLVSLFFERIRDSETAKRQEIEKLRQEKEQADAKLREMERRKLEAEQQEKARLERERQEKEQALAKHREVERQKLEAEARERERQERERSAPRWLGVRIENLSDFAARNCGLASTAGVFVNGADPGGPAETAGIKYADIILKFDDVTIKSVQHFKEQLQSSLLGTTVSLEICRTSEKKRIFLVSAHVGEGESIPQILRTSAEAGDSGAQFAVGEMHRSRDLLVDDESEAVKWYRKAAVQGHARAQLALGYMYHGGKGITQDSGEAVRWYRKAANQNLAEAQWALGKYFELGGGLWTCFFEGYCVSYSCPGGCSKKEGRDDCGCGRDLSEAVRWYRKAADQGFAKAQEELGSCYKLGQGVARNLAEAARWYQYAAEQNHPWAAIRLGEMYKKGQGVPRDRDEAIKWFRKVGACGFEQMSEEELRKMGVTP